MSEEKPGKRKAESPKPKAGIEEVKAESPKLKGGIEEVKGERQKVKGGIEEVKGERQKAKGRSEEVKAERQKLKVESAKPKALPVENKAEVKSVPEIRQPRPEALQTANAQLQTDTPMEVHHHPHLDHNPKPIKEYFLEGLMIFIAVMMGFIAENVREYIDNNEHAQQLCAQLVQDLKADTAGLNNINYHVALIGRQNDSLFNMLQQPLASVSAKEMLLLVNDSHSTWPFHPTGGAIEAIKNELQLRQFSKSDIISYIARYEAHIALMHTAQDIALQYQRLYTDPFMLRYFSPRDLDSALGRRPLGNVRVHTLTQADMTRMAGEMTLVQVITNEQLRDCGWLKQDATELLQYVQKHFDVQ